MSLPPPSSPAALAAAARRAATAALADDDLLRALTSLGYTLPSFSSALADAQALEAALDTAPDPVAHDARASFHRTVYGPHLNAARAVVQHPDARRRLELDRPRFLAFDSWVVQARRFYRTVLDDAALQTCLSQAGVPIWALCNALTRLDTLVTSSPDVQNLAERVGTWLAGLHEAAPHAVAHRPEWAEGLGLAGARA